MAEFTTRGVGNAGLSLGIVGTALSVLNGGLSGILGPGMYNYNGRNVGCQNMVPPENQFVTRYEMSLENKIQDKDSEIALLKSDQKDVIYEFVKSYTRLPFEDVFEN